MACANEGDGMACTDSWRGVMAGVDSWGVGETDFPFRMAWKARSCSEVSSVLARTPSKEVISCGGDVSPAVTCTSCEGSWEGPESIA